MANDKDSTISNLPGEIIEPNPDDFLVIDDSTDPDPLTKTKKIKIENVIPETKILPYDENEDYEIGEAVRLLDTETFICTTDTSVPAGPFDPLQWTPENGALETGVITTGFNNLFAPVGLTGNGTTTVSVALTPGQYPAGSFVVNDDIVVIGGAFTEPFNAPVKVASVIDANNFTYTASAPRSDSNGGAIINFTRINAEKTTGFIIDDNVSGVKRGYPVDIAAQAGLVFSPNITAAVNTIFVGKTDTELQTQDNSLTTTADSYDKLILGFLNGNPISNQYFRMLTVPDPTYKRGLSNRLDITAAGAKVYPGGVISPTNADLTMNITAGTLYQPGIFYFANPEYPDNGTFDAQIPIPIGKFFRLWSTGDGLDDIGVDSSSNTFDVSKYNPSNTLVDIPTTGPQFQIFRMYFDIFASTIYYGQELYNTIDEARALLDNDEFLEKSASKLAAFRGHIIAKRGITSFAADKENEDWLFIPKPQEYSIDRGNPERRSGASRNSIQAAIANQSTGVIEDGVVTLKELDIAGIVSTITVCTVTTDIDHGLTVGQFVKITDTTNFDGVLYKITSTPTSTIFTFDFTGVFPNETSGTVTSLAIINIEAGEGQVATQKITNEFTVELVSWNAENNILLSEQSGVDLTKSVIFVTKNSDGETNYTSSDDDSFNSQQIRDDILLAVIKTYQGLTTPVDAEEAVWSVENQRIALVALRSQIDDFNVIKYQVVSGATTEEANPDTTLTASRTAGRLVARGLNFSNSMESPNVLAVGARSLISYQKITTTGFLDGFTDLVTTPDPTLLDDGSGGTIAVSTNRYTVQRLWCEPENDQYLLQYGTAEYTLAEIEGLVYSQERPSNPPGLSATSFVISSFILFRSATNWDAPTAQEIFSGDITGGTASSAGGGGGNADTPWTEDHDAAGFNLTDLSDATIVGDDDTSFLSIKNVSNSLSDSARIIGLRANGTIAAPTPIQDVQSLVSLEAQGFDGVNYRKGGYAEFVSQGIWSGASLPTAFVVATTTAGSSHSAENFVINGSGEADFKQNPVSHVKTLSLEDSDNSHQFTISGQTSNLSGNVTLLLPVVSFDDTFVFVDLAQTLTNKTLTKPVIGDFTSAIHDHTDPASGGKLVATTALTATGTKDATTFLSGADTWIVPPNDSGIISINSDTTPAQVIAAGTGLGLVDATSTHTLSIDSTVVTLTGLQTLTNKTLTTPTIGDFSSAAHNHANSTGGGQLTNTALLSGDFNAITGIGTQGQSLNMGNNSITNISTIESPLALAPVDALNEGGELTLKKAGSNTIDWIIDNSSDTLRILANTDIKSVLSATNLKLFTSLSFNSALGIDPVLKAHSSDGVQRLELTGGLEFVNPGTGDNPRFEANSNDRNITLHSGLEFHNQSSGDNPVLESSSTTKRLEVEGEFGIHNEGTGGDPFFFSNSSQKSLTFDGRLEFVNAGTGDNPVLHSNSTEKALRVSGSLSFDNTLGGNPIIKAVNIDTTSIPPQLFIGADRIVFDNFGGGSTSIVSSTTSNTLLLNSTFVEANNITSNNGTPATVGFLRLDNAEDIAWRNKANNGDKLLECNTDDELTYNGVVIGEQLQAQSIAPEIKLFDTNGTTGLQKFRIVMEADKISLQAQKDDDTVEQEFFNFDAANDVITVGTKLDANVNDFINIKKLNWTETQKTIYAGGSVSGTFNIDFSNGSLQTIGISGALQFESTSFLAGNETIIKADSTGTHNLTWDSSWRNMNGPLPTSITSAQIMTVHLICYATNVQDAVFVWVYIHDI